MNAWLGKLVKDGYMRKGEDSWLNRFEKSLAQLKRALFTLGVKNLNFE